MTQTVPQVAVMLDLGQGYARHTGIFAGIQAYAHEQGWELIIDDVADDTLPTRRTKRIPFDGVIARAAQKLASRAAHLSIPVVNVWYGSPCRDEFPGVFRDHHAVGRMCAEHLLSRGNVRFASIATGAEDVRSRCGRRRVGSDDHAAFTDDGFSHDTPVLGRPAGNRQAICPAKSRRIRSDPKGRPGQAFRRPRRR